MTADRVPLDGAALRADVLGPVWRRLDVIAETRSTNADLLARAEHDDIDGAVLIAEHQTAGRGRRGRSWSGVPHAQVIMSVGVDVSGVPTRAWGWLPLMTGVAVIDTVAALGVEAALKWPNDVLAGDDKLAGILAEVAPGQQAVVIGVGLNVSLAADEVPLDGVASLTKLGVTRPDRHRIVADLLRALGDRLAAWRANAGADSALHRDYRAQSATFGQRVRAILPGDQEIVGTAVDVDDEGRLLVDTAGKAVTISAGDIVHLRPQA
ncbi:BirA family transcriptional regulator, biotin operon repressor / biotin-[acetyl-CoA-carboxylase] ligase [Mycolicibacterium rutilum]|uniref:biotin--[biotin carboxyl-carrier protein] ligase n=1 Tax=Mycolicibacterium rutilum TaxID=370526 RepID=A0A1H6M0T0_MYCRU|nr:biotin--[acetyl-CoA-carboxylase] ligase [Mycolicibacterium rutilum]SEH90978.1 BirA family transcriptional regulator, biotin operon repressor / biotin-[acetyl-CoA-carboxylase] ligase [Mycolicibacterium rutilum]